MYIQLGQVQYNTEANLTEQEFKDTYKGKLGMDLNLAWKLVERHSKKEKPKRSRKK